MNYFIYYSTPHKSVETTTINAQNISDCFKEVLNQFNSCFVYVYKNGQAFNNDDDILFKLDNIDINKYKHIVAEYELPKVGEFWQQSFDKIVKVEKEEHTPHKEIEIYKIYMIDEDDIEEFESDKKEYSEKTALSLNAKMEYLLLLK